MVNRDGFVKILDFGLAKLVRPFTDTDTTVPHTTPGAVFGTVGYVAEQASGHDTDFRSGPIRPRRDPLRDGDGTPAVHRADGGDSRADHPVRLLPVAQFNDARAAPSCAHHQRCLAKIAPSGTRRPRDLARDPAKCDASRTAPIPSVSDRSTVAAAACCAVCGHRGGRRGAGDRRDHVRRPREQRDPAGSLLRHRRVPSWCFRSAKRRTAKKRARSAKVPLLNLRLNRTPEFRVVETPEARGDRRVAGAGRGRR